MLNPKQARQVAEQIAAYKQGATGSHQVVIDLGNEVLKLTVDPYVASPLIMNSGNEVISFLKDEGRELLQGKTVIDMGTGCGIIGIAAALLGASHVLMVDIDPVAIQCAENNIRQNMVEDRCETLVSDLFDVVPEDLEADVIIFNHPFFAALPQEGEEWTQMMMAEPYLLKRFFSDALMFAHQDAVYLLPWLELAGSDMEEDNDPGKQAPKFGYQILERRRRKVSCFSRGKQRGNFYMYVLSHP